MPESIALVTLFLASAWAAATSPSRIGKAVMGLVAFAIYLLFAAMLEESRGVRLPQLFRNDVPRYTFVSDPYAGEAYPQASNPSALQAHLDARSYGRPYVLWTFVCTHMSAVAAAYLRGLGCHAAVVSDCGRLHAWVFVWTSRNHGWAVEPTMVCALDRGSLGIVVGDNWWDYKYGDPHTYHAFGDYERYYPTFKRPWLAIWHSDPSHPDFTNAWNSSRPDYFNPCAIMNRRAAAHS